MQHTLTCETLGALDSGAAKAIIDAAIREAVSDMDDRGDDKKPRSIEIKITMQKMESGLMETYVEAAAKVPRRRTASTVARLKTDGDRSRLVFQEYDSTNPDQKTIDELENKE